MQDPLPELVENILAPARARHRWHMAALLSQLSRTWRERIAGWREEQPSVSITAKKSAESGAGDEWLYAWERPPLDANMAKILVAEVPRCACLELLWWSVDQPTLAFFATFERLTCLLLETCAGIDDDGLRALEPLCPRLEKLSLWAHGEMESSALCLFLGRCTRLRAVTLNLQRYTQMRHDIPFSRAQIAGRKVIKCLATLKELRHVALYELEYDAVNKTAAYGDELELAEPVLAVLAKGCALESFKIAECLMETADDLAALGDCPSLTLLDWGARSSCEAIRSLCRGCPGLLDLTLNEESFPIDPKAVIEIATHCPRLTRLDVAENRKLDDAAVLALVGRLPSHPHANGCPRLRRLNLGLNDDFEDYDVLTVRSQITNLSIGCLCEPRVLPRLEWLCVRGRTPMGHEDRVTLLSELTPEHLEAVSRARPGLTIDQRPPTQRDGQHQGDPARRSQSTVV